ncbi:unnamed protein product [Cuscuta epithymum]|uniref:Uncharacterized protein n=1 Tax=Cuscuta epithymum TaxID=186058 RepID=A0AAV0DCS3_9ASTE|nr:unnamed protein product [Cuscuta epithymum]CAH9097873.1 unnamed protein product [Cuscuta epithymum]
MKINIRVHTLAARVDEIIHINPGLRTPKPSVPGQVAQVPSISSLMHFSILCEWCFSPANESLYFFDFVVTPAFFRPSLPLKIFSKPHVATDFFYCALFLFCIFFWSFYRGFKKVAYGYSFPKYIKFKELITGNMKSMNNVEAIKGNKYESIPIRSWV